MVGFTCDGNSLNLKSELRQFFKDDKKKKFIKQLHVSISGDFVQHVMKQERLNSSITQDNYLEMN